MDILKRGGNAADATVTTALCEGVFNPMASGIGGGGFITVLTKDGTAEVIDAREYAPTGATEKMYKGNTLRTLLCSFESILMPCLIHCPQTACLSMVLRISIL